MAGSVHGSKEKCNDFSANRRSFLLAFSFHSNSHVWVWVWGKISLLKTIPPTSALVTFLVTCFGNILLLALALGVFEELSLTRDLWMISTVKS